MRPCFGVKVLVLITSSCLVVRLVTRPSVLVVRSALFALTVPCSVVGPESSTNAGSTVLMNR